MNVKRVCSTFGTRFVFAAAVLACTAALVWAQTVTGLVSGTVTDPSGQIIVGATVTLINEATGDQRTANTETNGSFVFPAVQPGSYTIKVESKGFQALERKGNQLTPNQRLAAGNLQLTIGSATQTITVTAGGEAVQTESTEDSSLLVTKQIDDLAVRGRDVVSLLAVLPGVMTTGSTVDSVGAEFSGVNTPTISGVRNTSNNVTVDGMTGTDLGSLGSLYVTYVPLDGVNEVKLLQNNYQAEYGRGGGAVVSIVTKSGTKDFHGTAYWYKRHEMFDANNFFNNRTGQPKAKDRFVTEGATLGGPVPISKVRDKLFFFYSFERDPGWYPQSLVSVTMPTGLERTGDFSQSLASNGSLEVVKDPNTGAPFPGNVIPASRIDKSGQALLNVFPLPNNLNRAVTQGSYNFQFQESLKLAKTSNLFRIDYRPNTKDSLYFRGNIWDQSTAGFNGPGSMPAWGLFHSEIDFPNKNAAFNYTRVLSPNMVNEFGVGARHGGFKIPLPAADELAKIQRDKIGFTAGQLYPQNNPNNIIPLPSYGGGGISNAPSYNNFFWYRFPSNRNDGVYTLTDGLTFTHGGHTLKAGFYWEKDLEQGVPGTGVPWMGSISFSVDSNNPLDSGQTYSNAALGNFNNYTEPSAKPQPIGLSYNIDWYVQDSWKVSRRLTVELGLRVAYITPYKQPDGNLSAFALSRYSVSQAPVLFQPTLVSGKRLALNPLTGQTAPAVLIGAYVPGSGNPANGMVTAKDPNYPSTFMINPGELLQPRFGFAWDVFGNGKTALRLGFSKLNQIVRSENVANQPPIAYTPIIYYSSLANFLGAGGYVVPGSVSGWDLHNKQPNIYNLTFGIQQSVGFGTVVGVQYVGTLGRNLQTTLSPNTLPYGTHFQPWALDSTTGKPLPDIFLRPYPSLGSISYTEDASSSNYNALEVTVNRHFAKGLVFGVNYNWSKTLDYGTSMPLYQNARVWNYGLSSIDQAQRLIFTYTYDVPGLSRRIWANRFTRAALDHWRVSGVTSFASGTPSGVSFSTTTGADLTGGGDGQRINVTCDPNLSHDNRNFYHMFNTSCFALPATWPAPGYSGNAGRVVFRGPGFNNWDATLFKDFPITSEQRVLTFRWEFYNLPNHTQFSGVSTGAQFNPATGAQTSTTFGQATSARLPRTMQVSLRFRF